jgi:hypothetical protein
MAFQTENILLDMYMFLMLVFGKQLGALLSYDKGSMNALNISVIYFPQRY